MRCVPWLLVAACTPHRDVTTIVLRDPSRVTVAIATPSGLVELLHEGEGHADIPATRPPYLDLARSEAWIERDPSRLDVWCPHCGDDKRRTPVLGDRLLLDGTLAQVTHVGSDVRAHFVFRSTSQLGAPSLPRLALDLVTPADNVSSIHYERVIDTITRDRRYGLGSLVFIGAFLSVVGTTLVAVGHHEHETGLELAGVGPALAGVGVLIASFSLRDAPPSTWRGRHRR